jgi:hypothetical protein
LGAVDVGRRVGAVVGGGLEVEAVVGREAGGVVRLVEAAAAVARVVRVCKVLVVLRVRGETPFPRRRGRRAGAGRGARTPRRASRRRGGGSCRRPGSLLQGQCHVHGDLESNCVSRRRGLECIIEEEGGGLRDACRGRARRGRAAKKGVPQISVERGHRVYLADWTHPTRTRAY